MRQKHRGAISELQVCSYLLEQGYEVFRNVSQHGLIDLIGIKEGQISYFDVKTCSLRPKGDLPLFRLTEEQEAFGVKLVVVLPDGSIRIDVPLIPRRRSALCKTCGVEFAVLRADQYFCNKRCRPSNLRLTAERAESAA